MLHASHEYVYDVDFKVKQYNKRTTQRNKRDFGLGKYRYSVIKITILYIKHIHECWRDLSQVKEQFMSMRQTHSALVCVGEYI